MRLMETQRLHFAAPKVSLHSKHFVLSNLVVSVRWKEGRMDIARSHALPFY